jgi:hypothetical protein
MATKKPVAAKKAVPAKKTVAKKTVAKKTVAEPTLKTAKRKLSDATINKMAKAMSPKKAPAKKPATPAKAKLTVKGKSPKEVATAKGDPYVTITSVELDTDNIGNGAFELDWNDIFVAKLVRAGYQGKTDADVVDNWFKTICRNILTEEYEQWEANQPEEMRPRVIDRRDLGGGKTEVS